MIKGTKPGFQTAELRYTEVALHLPSKVHPARQVTLWNYTQGRSDIRDNKPAKAALTTGSGPKIDRPIGH